MSPLNRRHALIATTATLIAGRFASRATAAESSTRRFTMDLNPGGIGVGAPLDQLVTLAAENGFESIGVNTWALKSMSDEDLRALRESMEENRISWGAAGLPVDFRGDADKFESEFAALEEHCHAAQRAGADRMTTYLLPCHESWTYSENFDKHADRLRRCVAVLRDHGLRFGMEYVGTESLMVSKQYPFISTMKETGDLIDAIGGEGVGYVLDSWHWTTAGETADDIRSLRAADVIAADLNDAPSDLPMRDWHDTTRELPMATGVIDTKTFLQSLVDIGYDGPVRAEPFSKSLNAMDDEPAVAKTAEAMKQAFATIG